MTTSGDGPNLVMISTVKYPWSRWNLMDLLAKLSDVDYLRREWFEHDPSQYGSWAGPTEMMCGLFDDLATLPDPSGNIGIVVIEGEECERLRELGAVLDRVVDRASGGDEDELGRQYFADSEWPDVVRAAGLALAAMVRNWSYEVPAEQPPEPDG